jgi:thioredoxin 1
MQIPQSEIKAFGARLYIYLSTQKIGDPLVIKEINKNDFDRFVVSSKSPTLVDFWAEWCGPCRVFSPIIEELSSEFGGKVNFYKLNVDDNPEIAEKYQVMSIPTAMLFENGEVKAASIGAVPKETLKKWLSKNL